MKQPAFEFYPILSLHFGALVLHSLVSCGFRELESSLTEAGLEDVTQCYAGFGLYHEATNQPLGEAIASFHPTSLTILNT